MHACMCAACKGTPFRGEDPRCVPDVVERLVLVPVAPVGPLLVQQLPLCSHIHLVNGGVGTLGAGPEKVKQHRHDHHPVPMQ